MDQLILLIELGLLYALMLIPQLRLAQYRYDPHIGNLTASRISGHSLASIFFRYNYGVPIPVLSFSLQYDRFKGQLHKYKVCHALLVASTGPLLYLFANALLHNSSAALASAAIYALSFNCPVTGNWLIQCEHYENIFFLTGGWLVLSSNGSPVPTALGGLLLGCCLLCKFPALLSAWLISVLALRGYWAQDFASAGTVFAGYLVPFSAYLLAARCYPQEPLDAKGQGRRKESFLDILKGVPARYLYFYRRDPAAYLVTHLSHHLVGNLRQLLPVWFLAANFFLLGSQEGKWEIGLGVALVSLIFVLRMSLGVAFSFNVVLCIAAGLALYSLPQALALPVGAVAAAAGCFSLCMVLRDPLCAYYRKLPPHDTLYDIIARYLKENTRAGETIFCNINSSLAYLYPLCERGLPCQATFLTIGGYAPIIDHHDLPRMVRSEGEQLAAAIAQAPPQYIVQSTAHPPILNLPVIEYFCGVRYQVEGTIDQLALYRLQAHTPGKYDPAQLELDLLFDAVNGMLSTRDAVEDFRKRVAAESQPAPAAPQVPCQPQPGAECAEQTAPEAVQTPPEPPLPATRPELPSRHPRRRVCLFLHAYPPALLERIYREQPQAAGLCYSSQLDLLLGSGIGEGDSCSQQLQQAGWYTADLVVNSPELQQAWAAEHGVAGAGLAAILLEQLRQVQPDVVYLGDLGWATGELLLEMRAHCDLLVARHAGPLSGELSLLEAVFTHVPELVAPVREAGAACYYQPLAFDLRQGISAPSYQQRCIDVSFIGAAAAPGTPRGDLLERLAEGTALLAWGCGEQGGEVGGDRFRSRYQGEAKGRERLQLLKHSRIVVNHHLAPADCHGHRLLFEATGAGALLVTDYQEGLGELFDLGREVLVYRTPGECVQMVNHYLAHPEEAGAIAAAGRQRTQRDHGYARRMEQTAAVLEQHLLQLRRQEARRALA